MNMTPKEIVNYLDEYVIGQDDAKRTIALALRTRYRRMQLDSELQDEIMPKNILMIGSTGIGKTELSRRLAKMMSVPFIKVEASKYTEVGFVGRDVESMIRDLVLASINIVKEEQKEKNKQGIENFVLATIVDKLLPPLPPLSNENKKEEYHNTKLKMRQRVIEGSMDDKVIEIDMPKASMDFNDSTMQPDMAKMQESLSQMFGSINKDNKKKEVSIKEAKELLRVQGSDELLDMEYVKTEALKRAQDGGIIFLDEIDKIAVSSKSEGRNDPSKEGVQRDLLPIVEGSSVTTKYGIVNTDHILFIAAGAFHVSKPSDLIPELQGRFPLRVELESLTADVLYKILTQPKNSLINQYKALLSVEDVELIFEEDALQLIAKLSHTANEKTEDIGARRLHTVVEKILEEISFDADEYQEKIYTITSEFVHKKLDSLIEDEDTTRYIL
jgi:ATP-dependent HslUV protease ATP-binding subunit HslU